jgi:hypothetical protein
VRSVVTTSIAVVVAEHEDDNEHQDDNEAREATREGFLFYIFERFFVRVRV